MGFREEDTAFDALQQLRAMFGQNIMSYDGRVPKEQLDCHKEFLKAFLPDVEGLLEQDCDNPGTYEYMNSWYNSLFAKEVPFDDGTCPVAFDLLFVQGWKGFHRLCLVFLWAVSQLERLDAIGNERQRSQLWREIMASFLQGPSRLVDAANAFRVSRKMWRELQACVSDGSCELAGWHERHKERFLRTSDRLNALLVSVDATQR